MTDETHRHPAFTDAVRAHQARHGSRESYARIEAQGPQADLPEGLRQVIGAARSLYLATASADGQPSVQHRGGPPGFVRVLGDRVLGFADYAGNKQYVSTGNLDENPKVQLFLMDYLRQRRLKLWGTARMVEGDAELMDRVVDAYEPFPERVFVMEVTQWDVNCPKHIPQRVDAEDVLAKLEQKEARIAELERQVAVLEQKAWLKEGCAGAGDD